jgi:alpha-L-fucosidase
MKSLPAAVRAIEDVIASGPFSDTWDSLQKYRVPKWYEDDKFGIFIHWGLYAVPGFKNEWYPRQMYEQGSEVYQHHRSVYGPQHEFGYKDFIPRFKAERYDPKRWADLFRRAGAKFVMPVAEHHDGFAMYDCGFSDWSAVRMGPQRDLVGDLAQAVREAGMTFTLSSHRAEHWWFFNGGTKFNSDVRDPRFQALYGPAQPKETQPDAAFLDDWLARTCELVDKYRPQIVWFDWWIEEPAFAPYLRKFAAYYYNRAAQWNLGVAINYKHKAYAHGSAVFDIERGQLSGIEPLFWQTDTAISKNSWGYITHNDYKQSGDIVGDLVDIVSKNGALLLNLGPKPDGTIPEEDERILLDIGRWLDINGEAVYGTRPWRTFGEGPTHVASGSFTDTKRQAFTSQDIRYTQKGNAVYAILLAWPTDRKVTLRALSSWSSLCPSEIKNVQLLGCDAPVKWQRHGGGLTVEFPEKQPCEHAFTIKAELRE